MRTHVGLYRIEETLGRGGMGVVYRGVHERLNRTVAIKELAPELTQQPEFKERFFAEARTQARLQHPNIVSVYDLLEEGGEFFIVMEHVSGRPLDEVVGTAAGHRLEQGTALAIFAQVLAALDYAHSEAVIHRDIKPSNVLVTESGRVKLMDFGIALLVGDKRLTSSQATVGTPIYMSPEQILRPRLMDHRTDIYSAAIVLYEMLAGGPPFDADSAYEINKLQIEAPPPDLCALVPGVAPGIAAAVHRALAKEPDERFVSAAEFSRALEEAAPPAAFSGRTSTSARASAPTVQSTERGTAPPAHPPASAAGHASAAAPAPARAARGPSRMLVAAGVAGGVVVLAGALALGRSLLKAPPEPAGAPQQSAPAATSPSSAAAPAPAAALPASLPGGLAEAAPVARPQPSEAAVETERPRAEGSRLSSAPRPPSARASAAAGLAAQSEAHRREVAKIRELLRTGMAHAEAELDEGQFSAAHDRVAGLLSLAASDQSDLVDEVVSLRLLEKRVTSGMVAAKTAAKEAEVEQSAWKRRLQEIRDMIGEKRFPEAKVLAGKLAADGAAPPDVAAQARDLAAQADQELKRIFSKAKFGQATNDVQKKPPPP